MQDKVQRYLQQAQQADGQRPTALQAAGLAARNAGDMLLSEGKLSQALARFQASAEIFGKLAAQGAQDPPQPLSASSAPMRGAAVAGQRPASAGEPALQAQRPLQAQAEQARSLFRLGDAQFAQGHSTLALATHNRALSLRKQVAAATSRGPQAMDAVIEQSLSHSAVGKVLNDLGRPRDALQELDASLKLLAPLPTAEAQPKLLKALIDAYDNRADALAWLDQVPAKRVAYEQTDRLYADWRRRQPLSAEARQGAVFAAVRRATKMAEQDLLPEALRAFEEGEASMDELVRWDSRNVPWQRDLQGIRLLKAGVQKDVGDFKAARQALDVVLPRFKQMAMADPSDLPRLRDLGWVHQERGLLATAQTQRADAVRDLAAAERFYAKVAAAAPDSAKSKQDWYWSIYNLAVAQRAAGRRAEALAQVRAGQRVVAALMRGSSQIAALPSDQVRYFYVMELQLLKEAGDHARSDAVLRQMQQVVAGALAAARPAGAKLLDAAAVVDSQLAQRATAAGRASEALALRRSGLEKSRRATAQDPAEPLWWDNQAAAASALAEHHAASLRWRDAAAAYREEIVALEQAVKLAPQQLQNTTVAPTTSESAVAAARTPGQDAANDRTPAVALTLGRRANRLYLAQINLGDALDASGDPKAAFDAYTGSLASINRAIALNGSEAVYFSNLRAAWVRIAKNRSKLDNNTAAFDAYTAAEEPARSAFDKSQSPEARARAANWAYLLDVELGDLLVKQRNRDGALARFVKGREWIDKAIAAAPQTSLYQGNLSALRLRMATQQRELRDGKAEETSLRDAVAAAELGAKLAVAGEPVAEQAARQVERMRAYNDLAAWHERQKDTLAALAARRNALAAIERAAALAPGQASHQDALRAANRVIADHETAPVAADRAWRAAATAALRAVELAPSAERSNEAARSLFELGEQLATRSAWTPALSAYQAAAQQAQLAVKADPQAAENWLGLSVCQRQVALMLAKLPGREGEAVAVFESAMASGTNATERAPQNVQAWRSLYLARRDLALQLEQSGNPASARTQLGRAMQEADRALAINANDSTVQDEIDQLREDAKRLRPP